MNSTGLTARFSVVSFNETATMRVTWSMDDGEINAAIDAISPDGPTSISSGFDLTHELLNNARDGADRVVLFLSDGEQTVDKADGKTLNQTAIEAAQRVKDLGAKVFAWGFGDVSVGTLKAIASDDSKVQFMDDVFKLAEYLISLEAEVCNESPPSLPPSPLPPSPSLPPSSPSPPPPSPSPPPPSPPPPCNESSVEPRCQVNLKIQARLLPC